MFLMGRLIFPAGPSFSRPLVCPTCIQLRKIFACNYSGHNVRPLTQDKSIAILPRWPPNGKKSPIILTKPGDPCFILRDFVSVDLRRLSSRSGLNIGAYWAPDDKKLALTISHKENPDIYTIFN